MGNNVEFERQILRDNVEGWRNRLWVMEYAELPKPSMKAIANARGEFERAEQRLRQFERENSE